MILNKRFLALIKKEFLSVWRDKKSRAVIIFPPILQLFIFSYAATLDITNIKIGILDKDNGEISREFIRQIKTSRYFTKTYFLDNEKELKNLMDREKIRSAVYINNDFTKKYKANLKPQVLIVTDGRRTNSSSIISGYITEIAQNFSPIGLHPEKQKVNIITENAFNPNLSYHWFILASLFGIIPMSTVMLLSSFSFSRDRENGSFRELLVLPLKDEEILFSKVLISLFFGLLSGISLIILSLIFFKIPFQGSFLAYLSALFVFLLSISLIGIFVSTISKSREQAMTFVFLFMFPAITLSGYTTPIENITPEFLQHLTVLNPLRFFLVISKGIILKNMNFYYVFLNILPILTICVLCTIATIRGFQTKIR